MEVAMKPIIDLQRLITSLIGKSKRVEFTEASIDVFISKTEKVPLESFSSGEKQIIRILIEVLLAQQSALIIDEPELSLHIDWQRDLVKTMRTLNNTSQIIIATHSPEIMAHVPDSKIFLVD
jgi:predicted ATPase